MNKQSSISESCLGIIQPKIMKYRANFFDLLANDWKGDVHVLASPSTDGTPNLEVAHGTETPTRSFFRGRFELCWQSGITRWLDRVDPAALVTFSNPRYLSHLRALRWMRRRNRVAVGWGLGTFEVRGNLKRQGLRNLFLSQLDGMIAYGTRAARQYVEAGMPEERVFVAPNSVSMKPTWSYPERSADPNRQLNVLFVGTLLARKKVDYLIQACADLQSNLQPELSIVGSGPALSDLETYAQRVYPRTRFLKEKYGDELAQCFRDADVFVIPGTGGLAIQEAMSYGVPVIVAEADGTQEDLVREENGWNVTADRPELLTATLKEAFSDRERLREMGRASYKIVANEINLQNMVQKYVNAVQKIIAMGPRKR